ncbi:DUF4405 domain-containing protein, partial [Thioclava sp. BHET1]
MYRTASTTQDRTAADPRPDPQIVRRHRLSTRIWHWINLATMVIMLMSGLMIFNAHPQLYWGQHGAEPDIPWFEIGNIGQQGFLRLGPVMVTTTGWLGVWRDAAGDLHGSAFPGWITLPGHYNLALARNWHLTFAWVFALGLTAYLLWSLVNRHLWRDLAPNRAELHPNHIWTDIKHHATLNFPKGEAARRYNILQKFAYLGMLLLVLPGLVLTGLTMSPAMNAAWPWLIELFGGRQSARSIHFICATLFILFVLVHLLMVILAGPLNEIRSM